MGSAKFRVVSIAVVPIAAIALITVLPKATLQRLASFSSDTDRTSEISRDADGSSDVRRELFKKSVQYTIQHPLFGVGPAQFSSFEGGESISNGKRGLWHQTHNTLTQISSECGIPAVTFYLCAIVSAFLLVLKTIRVARSTGNEDIAAAAFCLMLGIWGFLSASMFLNFAYRFYQPAFCGLCIVLYNAAKHEMAERRVKAATATPFTPPWAPQVSPTQAFPRPLTTPAPAFSNKSR
jgi:O-antigen ligase